MNENEYPTFRVLLVDDELPFLRSMSLTLERHGITNLETCARPQDVQFKMRTGQIGLVVLDLTMPDMSGLELLKWLNEEYPEVCVVILSGMNQVDAAVECVKQGAFDYFVKTSDQDQILEGLKRAIRTQELTLENQALRKRMLSNELEHPHLFEPIVTSDPGMWSVFRYLESIAESNQPVLIQGESGVGKELIAQVTHKLSGRSGKMVTVNVAGLDDNIFADTLFGHSRGAFTGAERERPGLIEQASGGTLFLDEIGDLSQASQVKLLRLLQEGEYYPLGSDSPKRTQARIIVATHQNLEQRQLEGRFRKDLYFRLRTHRVDIPPLRARAGDLPILIEHFVTQACREMNRDLPGIPKKLIRLMSSYPFPGNARELKALVYDAVSRTQTGPLSCEPFEALFTQPPSPYPEQAVAFDATQPLPTLSDMADQLVREAMLRAQHNQSLAARMLGISQPALSKRLKNMKDSE